MDSLPETGVERRKRSANPRPKRQQKSANENWASRTRACQVRGSFCLGGRKKKRRRVQQQEARNSWRAWLEKTRPEVQRRCTS